ncbi:MAG: EAL domain-containing protein [Hyphomicrobiaceae bacterium]
MTPDTLSPTSPTKPALSAASHVFVLFAMSLVATAIGAGASVHLGIAKPFAVAAGVVAWLALLGVHLLARRTLVIEQELEALKLDRAFPEDAAMRSPASSAAVAPGASLPAMPTMERPRTIEQPRQAPVAPAHGPVASPAATSGPAGSTGAPFGAAGPVSAPAAPAARPAAQVAAAPRPAGVSPAVDKVRPAPFLPAQSRVARDEAMPAASVPPGQPAAGQPAGIKPAAMQPGAPLSDAPAAAPVPHVVAQPATPAPAMAGVPKDEVERIEKLILRLAQDLAPDGGAPVPGVSPDEAISRSVAALKETATTMRQAQDRGGAGDPAPSPSLPRDGGVSIETEVLARMQRPMRGQPQAQPAAGVADAVATAQPQAAPTPSQQSASPSMIARITDAIEHGRMDIYLQPICGLGDRQTRYFDVSVRLRDSDGTLVQRRDYCDAAAGTGLLPRIDLALLAGTTKIVRRISERGKTIDVFSALSGESLDDEAFLHEFSGRIREEATLPDRLVISLTQSAVRGFAGPHWDTVAALAAYGFRFALQDLVDLDMDFEDLKAKGFAFVKLDADIYLSGLPAGETRIPSLDVCRYMAEMGFGLIVEGISDEARLGRIADDGVLLGQGQALGEARPVKAEVLAGPANPGGDRAHAA